jgi:hypothetical protein
MPPKPPVVMLALLPRRKIRIFEEAGNVSGGGCCLGLFEAE